MSSISSLVFSGYNTASSSNSRSLNSQSTAATSTDDATQAETETDPVTKAFEDAATLGEDLATEWSRAQAKAELVYQLITGGKMDDGDVQDNITNMLLTAYDQLHTSSDKDALLEDMPGYALALEQWASMNNTTSTFSILA
ncbi:hypothetical protein [Roseibium sp.]|uniref:hypothetical protein n=1 Tax=Roseibium sp. TaxID=1936156 RepID=UPI003A9773A4